MAAKPEIYVSIDIEADGPIPGPYSMLSLGAAAFLEDKTMLSTFSANLDTLEGAAQHEDTMAWWNRSEANKAAYRETRKNTKSPELAMREFADWLKSLPGKPVLTGFPVTYDFLFVYWYVVNFVGMGVVTFAGLDIKTYAMAMLKCNYKKSAKRNFPKRWFGGGKHTHIALDDAIEQGMLFCNMLEENKKN